MVLEAVPRTHQSGGVKITFSYSGISNNNNANNINQIEFAPTKPYKPSVPHGGYIEEVEESNLSSSNRQSSYIHRGGSRP